MTKPISVPYARNDLFRGIPGELLRREKIVTRKLAVGPGTVIFDEGELPTHCYLVGSGAVQITKSLPGGRHELLATLGPGQFFGELALYDSSVRSARATAPVRTRLAMVDQETFSHLRRVAALQVACNLVDCAIERVRQTNARLVSELAAAARLTTLGTELGTLSHNLRSPLATIRNAADVLEDILRDASAYADGDGQRFLGIVRGTADRTLAHIDYVMARVRGELEAERERVPGPALLRGLRELAGGHLASPLVRYREEVQFAGEVEVDRCELLAVLCNLVKNAVEALPAEGGEVEVEVAPRAGSVVFSVSDSGMGIPPDRLPELFRDGFSHGKAGGTGLGLAHARRFAEMHGGRIEVESEVGRGTTVRLVLPDAQREQSS